LNVWAFYLGHHWAYRREAGEPQITFNYVRALSDWLTNFTFSNGITFESDEAYQHIIPALLDRIWAKDNDKLQTLWTIGNAGSVQGDSFVKIAYDPAYVDPAGNPHPGRVRLLPLNASFCFPSWHPHDRERLVRFKLKYRFWGDTIEGTRQVHTYCVDDKTQALTNNGWKYRWEIQENDKLLSIDSITKNISYQPLIKLNTFDWDGPLTKWKSTQMDALTTPDHRWITEHSSDRNPKYHSNHPYQFKLTKDLSGNGKDSGRLVLSGGIPMHFPETGKYSDEFIELVAWHVNEGYEYFYSGRPNIKYSTCIITQSESHNPDYVERLRWLVEHFNGLGYTMFERFDKNRPEMRRFNCSKELGLLLRDVAPNKQITDNFLSSLTEAQARIFYRVCIDADGNRRKDTGLETWAQKDMQRIASFQRLVSMLGMRSSVKPHGKDCFSVSVYRHERVSTNSLKVSQEYYSGKVWCPTVETGTWLARRNGQTYWTGNCEILDDEWIEEYVDDELIDRRKNPLGFIPVVHIANKVASASPWGLSDVIDVIPLNRDFNEKATEISDIINYSTAPVTIITGASAANLEKSANKIWSLRQKDATVQNLSSDFSTLGPAVDFLQMLKLGMHEMIGIPEAALGTAQAVSNTSGVALSIQYMPTIHAYKQKKIQYEKGIREISEMALKTLFLFEPEQLIYNPATDGIMQEPSQMPVLDANDPAIYDVSVKWPPPLPVDKTIKLTEIQAMQALGLESNIGALRELGVEFPDEKFQEIFTEKVDDMEQEAALQIRRAIVAAYVQKLTGLVPEGYTEQDDKPKEGEPGKPPTAMDNTSTNGILPSMPTISDVTGISNTNMLSNITAQAFGTKLPQQSLRKNQSQDD
jgi:hypothetical protein